MGDTQGLTVGLAVGIPSVVIIGVIAIFWIRNQRKQLREDLDRTDIDIELQDDQSFTQFHEALHRHKQYDGSADKVENSSTYLQFERVLGTDSSNGSSSSDQQQPLQPPPHQAHIPSSKLNNHSPPPARQPSVYDFYETFIPVLPQSANQPTSGQPSARASTADLTNFTEISNNNDTTSMFLYLLPSPPPQATVMAPVTSGSGIDSGSVSTTGNGGDLDMLAKQLHGPQFFEKLPSKATKVQLKSRYSNYNNSSSELINNYLISQTTAINDHFTYQAPPVDDVNNIESTKVRGEKENDIHAREI